MDTNYGTRPGLTLAPELCSLCHEPLDDDSRDECWHTAHEWCANVERDAMRGDDMCDHARDAALMREWGAKQ